MDSLHQTEINPTFIRLTEGFKEWLHIIGYASSSVENLPGRITALFEYSESKALPNCPKSKAIIYKPFTNFIKSEKANRPGNCSRTPH